ncbi:hypothetical protein DEGR_08620 [Deinococcus grandis]|nr:hypothetical protein DEGR_08620 [Deinococcus grandis]
MGVSGWRRACTRRLFIRRLTWARVSLRALACSGVGCSVSRTGLPVGVSNGGLRGDLRAGIAGCGAWELWALRDMGWALLAGSVQARTLPRGVLRCARTTGRRRLWWEPPAVGVGAGQRWAR